MMRKRLRLSGFLLVCLLAALSPSGIVRGQTAGEAMFRGNAARTGEMPGPGPAGSTVERWRFATGAAVESAPTVVDGVIYVGSGDANVHAIVAATGSERWRFTTGNKVQSSPAVVDGMVHVGSLDKNVYALDAATGSEQWRFTTGDWVISSPAVTGGVVYAGSRDGNVYAIGGEGGEPVTDGTESGDDAEPDATSEPGWWEWRGDGCYQYYDGTHYTDEVKCDV
jgi:outer membrane protein assembly factor BamB